MKKTRIPYIQRTITAAVVCVFAWTQIVSAAPLSSRATIATSMHVPGVRGALGEGLRTYAQDEHRESGFVFKRKPNKVEFRVGKGTFDGIRIDPEEVIWTNICTREFENKEKLAERYEERIAFLLSEVKRRLLQKTLISENDFNCTVSVEYGSYKAVTYERRKKDNYVPHIAINWHCFRDLNFLALELEHVIVADKLKEWFPEISPALRELYCNLSVNIRSALLLKRVDPDAAQVMLDRFSDVAHARRGLYSRYTIAVEQPYVNAAEFFDSIVIMMMSDEEAVYFESIRNHMRALILNEEGALDHERLSTLKKEWKALEEKVRLKRVAITQPEKSGNRRVHTKARQTEAAAPAAIVPLAMQTQTVPAIEPESLISYSETLNTAPQALAPFRVFAERVAYRVVNELYVFVRIDLSLKGNGPAYAYVCLGVNDSIESVLDSRGHMFGLTLQKWKQAAPQAFAYAHEGVPRDLELRRSYLYGMKSLKEFAETLSMGNEQERKKCEELLRAICLDVYGDKAISQRSWQKIKKDARVKSALRKNRQLQGRIQLIERAYVNSYLRHHFPLLLNGSIPVHRKNIADIEAWPVVVGSAASIAETVQWMLPGSREEAPARYARDPKLSINSILDELDRIDVEEGIDDRGAGRIPLFSSILHRLNISLKWQPLVEQTIFWAVSAYAFLFENITTKLTIFAVTWVSFVVIHYLFVVPARRPPPLWKVASIACANVLALIAVIGPAGDVSLLLTIITLIPAFVATTWFHAWFDRASVKRTKTHPAVSVKKPELPDYLTGLRYDGTSGIRGQANKVRKSAPYLAHLSAEMAELQGVTTIVVGYDSRKSSREIAFVVANIMKQHGINVILPDTPLPSPMLSYYIARRNSVHANQGVVGGIVITGSHNPSGHNGFCLYTRNGAVMITRGNEIKDSLRAIVKKYGELSYKNYNKKILPEGDGLVQLEDEHIVTEILMHTIEENAVLNSIQKTQGRFVDRSAVRILYDSLKGVGAYVMPALFKALGFGYVGQIGEKNTVVQDYYPIIKQSDRQPYPSKAYARDWQSYQRKTNCNIVMSNDGDGDRFAIIDEEFIDWNELFVLLLHFCGDKDIYKQLGYTHIVATQTTTNAIDIVARHCGLEVVRVSVGFKYISAKITEIENAGGKVFAGFEGNGGLLLRCDSYMMDKDGVVANILFALIKAESLAKGNYSLKDDVRQAYVAHGIAQNFGYMQEIALPKHEHTEDFLAALAGIRRTVVGRSIDKERSVYIDVVERRWQKLLRRYTNIWQKKRIGKTRRIEFRDKSWFVARSSGTEDLVRFYVEANTALERNILAYDLIEYYLQFLPQKRRAIYQKRSKERIVAWLEQNNTPEVAHILGRYFADDKHKAVRENITSVNENTSMHRLAVVHDEIICDAERTFGYKYDIVMQRSTIDLNRGQSKVSSIYDFKKKKNIHLRNSVYFGDRFGRRGNDAEIAAVRTRQPKFTIYSVESSEPESRDVVWLQEGAQEKNTEVTYALLAQIRKALKRHDHKIDLVYNGKVVGHCNVEALRRGEGALFFDIDGTIIQNPGETLADEPGMLKMFRSFSKHNVPICFITGNATAEQKRRIIDPLRERYPDLDVSNMTLYTVGGAVRSEVYGSGDEVMYKERVLVKTASHEDVQALCELLEKKAQYRFGLSPQALTLWGQWYESRKGKRVPENYDASWMQGNKQWHIDIVNASEVPQRKTLTFPYIELRRYQDKIVGIALKMLPSAQLLQSKGMWLNESELRRSVIAEENKERKAVERLQNLIEAKKHQWPIPSVAAAMYDDDGVIVGATNDVGVDHHADVMLIFKILKMQVAQLESYRVRERFYERIHLLEKSAVTRKLTGDRLLAIRVLAQELGNPFAGKTVYVSLRPNRYTVERLSALGVTKVAYVYEHADEEYRNGSTEKANGKMALVRIANGGTPHIDREYETFHALRMQPGYEGLKKRIRALYVHAYQQKQEESFRRELNNIIGIVTTRGKVDELRRRLDEAFPDDEQHAFLAAA